MAFSHEVYAVAAKGGWPGKVITHTIQTGANVLAAKNIQYSMHS